VRLQAFRNYTNATKHTSIFPLNAAAPVIFEASNFSPATKSACRGEVLLFAFHIGRADIFILNKIVSGARLFIYMKMPL